MTADERMNPPQNCGNSVTPCSVDSCQRQVKAKGLCEKHYRRMRRTGDPNQVRKPGPAPDPYRAQVRGLQYSDFGCERTMQTYVAAMAMLGAFADHDAFAAALAAATRPNGSLNVSKLRRLADAALMGAIEDGRI
ncbi:hypothetical protein [Mycobacterium sp. E787]|uniref:hypothetical protein n=1 Tax=Mycobacterium sp. E787 TaxID=1834150 RepID=UPI0007FC7D82|nr:hypothetical protein [Mycobacterium sp. E787]OBI53596.1 hypothetical protein A5705_02985 [Mycobacterium sp. E787]